MSLSRLGALLALLFAYIGVRLLPPLPGPGRLALGLGLLSLFGVLWRGALPALGRRGGSPGWIWAGLLAMGLFSSLFVFTLLRDGVLLGAAMFGSAGPLVQPTALAVPLLALAASAWGFGNARRAPRIRRVDVPLTGLPPGLHGLRFLQISDLHVGPTIRRAFVERVVEAANREAADIVVLTGDLVDGSVAELAEHIAPLAGLRARHGVFAVTGNHEYYSGAGAWIAEFRRLGFDVLMNRHVVVEHGGSALLLAGVADFTAHHFDESHRSDPQQALVGAPPRLYPKVLLAHQPRTADAAAAAGFDLQLSGHTHGGQFFPWNFFVPLQQPYTAGLHRHRSAPGPGAGGLWVYTSRGTGYWGPPKRLGAPSEITLLRLVPA